MLRRAARCAATLVLGGWLAAGARGGDQAPGLATAAWKLEAVELKDGRRLEGLIAAPAADADAAADVYVVQVVRRPGRPMYLVTWGPLAAERVAAFSRLPPAEHARLAARIQAFRDDATRRINAETTIELSRAAEDAPWRYESDDFVLESRADPGVTREAALRLTQVFEALTTLVPPVVPAGRPTTVRLCGSTADYLAEQEALGIRVANPAFFVPEKRLLVAGSDMPALVARHRAAAAANAGAARRLEELDRRLPERLKSLAADLERQGMPPPQRAEVVQKARGRWQQERAAELARVEAANRENDSRMNAARRGFYARLAHEAWHAYAEARLRPAGGSGLPAWLDEGLAQVVESAPLEAGELRLDAADPQRLAALQAAIRAGRAPAVVDVLRAGPEQFVAGHAAAADLPGRSYLVAWGLAFDLAMMKPVLTPTAVTDLARDDTADTADTADAIARFERLVGGRLADFEAGWRERIMHLRGVAGPAVTPDR